MTHVLRTPNWAEFLVPSTGEGRGVQRYGRSASQYIQAVIEYLFGVDYGRSAQRLRIFPRVPAELIDKDINLDNLILPTGGDTRLRLHIRQSDSGEIMVVVEFVGWVPDGALEVLVPASAKQSISATNEKGESLAVVTEAPGLVNVVGVRLPMTRTVELRFK